MKKILREICRGRRTMVLLLALLLVLNLLVAAGHAFWLRPSLVRKQDELASLDAARSTDRQGESSAWFQQGTRDVSRVRALLPSRRQFPQVIGRLLAHGAATRIALGPVTYKSRSLPGRQLQACDLALAAKGSYAAAKNFLHGLQTSRDFLVIDGMRLSNDEPYGEQVTVNLRLTVYLRDEP